MFITVISCQQSTETVPAIQTQDAELAESLRAEFHETACKIQSLQVETESLKTLVSKGPGVSFWKKSLIWFTYYIIKQPV